MNRDTVNNVVHTGFELRREGNVFLDVVKAIEARRPTVGKRGSSFQDGAEHSHIWEQSVSQ